MNTCACIAPIKNNSNWINCRNVFFSYMKGHPLKCFSPWFKVMIACSWLCSWLMPLFRFWLWQPSFCPCMFFCCIYIYKDLWFYFSMMKASSSAETKFPRTLLGTVPKPRRLDMYTMPAKAPQRYSQLSFPNGATPPTATKSRPNSSAHCKRSTKLENKQNYHPKSAKHHENAKRPNGFKLWGCLHKMTCFNIKTPCKRMMRVCLG